jgi:hypothetical protein
MKSISFSDNVFGQEARDITTLIHYLSNEPKLGKFDVHIAFESKNEDPNFKLMTTVRFIVIAHDKENSTYVYNIHRAKDFTCHNIMLNKVNLTK